MAKKLLQRVVWNSAGWRKPTGAANDGGYFAENGFGHEEWNLQTEDAVDGDVLGYVYWEPGEKSLRDSGGVFDIGFWAIHPEARRRLLVGRYAAARPADDVFRERVLAEFEERGVFERRASELRAAVPGLSQREADKRVRESIELGWMRFRCPVSSVVVLEPSEHIELPERLQTGGLSLRFASRRSSPTSLTPTPAPATSTVEPLRSQRMPTAARLVPSFA